MNRLKDLAKQERLEVLCGAGDLVPAVALLTLSEGIHRRRHTT